MDQSGQVGTRKISEAPVCLDSANQPRTDTLSPASHTLPPPSVLAQPETYRQAKSGPAKEGTSGKGAEDEEW